MFDKLIVSEPEGADFKSRRSYFMVSTLVVGVLFTTAVVISIYAAEIGLGHDSLELVEMIAPPEMAAVEPETPQPRQPTSQSESASPTRPTNMSRVDEPTIVPTTTSTQPNSEVARPPGRFDISPLTTEPAGTGLTGPPRGTDVGPGGNGLSQTTTVAEDTKVTEPPPVVRTRPIVSGGVVNGKAKFLPVPNYSAAARQVRAQGQVNVQVLIDESGHVLSAKAIDGHPLLRREAENAARNAKFTPTYLTDVAVKVNGVIIYNFKL